MVCRQLGTLKIFFQFWNRIGSCFCCFGHLHEGTHQCRHEIMDPHQRTSVLIQHFKCPKPELLILQQYIVFAQCGSMNMIRTESVCYFHLQFDSIMLAFIIVPFHFASETGLLQKGKKRQRKKSHADLAEPAEKKTKTHTAEPEFSHVRFKFLLRSPETVVKGKITYFVIIHEYG